MNGEAVWQWAETLAAWAWRASWQGALLAAVAALSLWVAGRRVGPAWRFGLWGLVLVRLAMPAVVRWEWRGGGEARPDRVAVRSVERVGVPVTLREKSVVTTVRPDVALEPRISHAAPVPRATIAVTRAAPAWRFWDGARRYVIVLWLSGVLLLGVRVMWSSVRLGRAVRRMRVIEEGRVLKLLRDCCDEFRIRRVPELRELPGVGAPALVGFWRPRVLLPAQVLERLGEDELRLILMHELAHVKRRDVLVNWVATLVAVVHWLNPAVWLVVWRMRVEREMACDEMVLREGRGQAYGRTIVRLAEALSAASRVAPPAGAVGILEGRAQLQRRLLMIARYDAKRRRGPVVAMGLAMLIGAAALTGVTRAGDEPSKPATTDKSKPTVDKGAPAAPKAGGSPLPGSAGVPAAVGGLPGGGAALGGLGNPAGTPGGRAAGVGGGAPAVMGGLAGSPAGVVTLSPEEEKANAKTAEMLKQPIAGIKFEGQTLFDVVSFLRDVTKVDILVEWPALEQVGVTRDTPVTLSLREPLPAESVLPLMFRAMGADVRYEIDRGVVVIGPSSKAPSVVTRVYDVRELVSETSSPAVPALAARGGLGGPAAGGDWGDACRLTQLITATVEPQAWSEAGGPSTLAVFKNKLVVKAPEGVQKEVASLLEMLRDKPAGKEGDAGGGAGLAPKAEKHEHGTP